MPFTQCSFNLVLKFRLCITADCQERREGGKSGKLVNDICAFKFALAQSAPSVSVQEEAADGKRQRKRCSAVDPGNVRSLGSAVVNALIYRCLVTTWAQPQSRGHSHHGKGAETLHFIHIILVCWRNFSFLLVFGGRALPKAFLHNFFDENLKDSHNSI